MAARKKCALTPEEQLEAALVPEEEWPYELPDNWCWVRLGTCISKSTEKSNTNDPAVLYVGLENFESGVGIAGYANASGAKSVKSVFRPGQILYGRLRPYLNKHDVAKVEGVCSTDILVYEPNECAEAQYVDLFLDTKEFIEHAVGHSKGINLPRVSSTEIEAAFFPLPPLHEQRRIASRLEWLFSKLDDAEAELREVIESSEQRQASILHRAFSGKLTLRSDDSNQVWPRVAVGTIASGLKYGTSEKSTYENNGMPVLRIPNVSSSHVDLGDMKYLSHNDVKPADTLQEGDILMIRSNGSRDLVGRCAVVPALDEPYAYASFLIRIRPSDKVDPYYLWYFLQSPDAKAQLFTKAKSSSGIHNINSKEIGATIMPLPSLDMQRKIVRILNAFFDSENKARSGATDALDAIRMTRESILSKALRGELVTNDPAEPSSKKLLASILSGNAGK